MQTRSTLIALLMLASTLANAGVAPVQRYSSNVQKPLEGRDLTFMQDSSQDLYWTFKEALATNVNLSAVKDLTGATAATFTFSPADRSWRKTVTGSIPEPTNGTVYIAFSGTGTAANALSPNSISGSFDYIIRVTGGSTNLAYAKGSLTIEENVFSTGGDLYSIDNIVINWLNYGGYTNTASKGPYRTGTGIGFTTNSDGSCNINLTNYPFAKTTTNSPTRGYVLLSDGTTSNTYWGVASNAAATVAVSGGLLSWSGNVLGLSSQTVQDAVSAGTELDPVFVAWLGTNTQFDSGSTAFAWGDHATNGYLLPASTNTVRITSTNEAIQDILNRGYLLPASTQSLVTVTQLATATNSAIIDATNRVAGVGYLLVESDPSWSAWRTNAATGTTNAILPNGSLVNIATLLGTSVDTLQSVVNRGNSATNVGSLADVTDLSGTGRRVFGTGLILTNITASAVGASQSGKREASTTVMTIGAQAYGSAQHLYGLEVSTNTIAQQAYGVSQWGYSYGTMSILGLAHGSVQHGSVSAGAAVMQIGSGSEGAAQFGQVFGRMVIVASEYPQTAGASQFGYVEVNASATNSGTGAMQLMYLLEGEHALTTSGGSASLLLGAGISSNKNAIVAGDGQVSHGDGSISAAAMYVNGNAVLTNTSAFGVSSIINGSTTNIGAITFTGTRVSATAGTVTFTNVEYVSQTVVPTSSSYEYYWFGPRDVPVTIKSVYALTDAYTVTFDVVEANSNSTWRTVTTNTAPIIAPATSISVTTFVDPIIEAGHRFGVRILPDSDPRTLGFTFGLKLEY